MNNIAGGCSNRVSNLFRAELGSVSLRYKARHHFNTELSISDVAGDKLHRHISLTSCPQGGEESTAYNMPCYASAVPEQWGNCSICPQRILRIFFFLSKNLKNTQKSINFSDVLLNDSQTFIHPNKTLCFQFVIQSDGLRTVYLSVFFSILGAI